MHGCNRVVALTRLQTRYEMTISHDGYSSTELRDIMLDNVTILFTARYNTNRAL